MSISTRVSKFVPVAAAIAVLYSTIAWPAAGVLWLDFDMKNIPEPKERKGGYYEFFFKGQLIEQTKQDLDIPRWVRHAAGHPKQASNVNALDEVPESSWFTNRHHLHRMTIEELVRGPDRGSAPDFTSATITKAKTEGVTPGLMLKDSSGQSYLVKFDNANYPKLQSGAEVISTKIMYAAGYNVPENYIAYLSVDDLHIGKDVTIKDEKGNKRPFTKDDLDHMLTRVARMSDGRYRVMASKILSGKPKGPFPQIGFRADDPNDLIPHEYRRELRGLRVIASWINHWDMKEDQGLDMYVEENGRRFLRHYLIDFGSTLGGGQVPTEYFHGREYALDMKSIMKEVFTLGAFESADEKHGLMVSQEVGMYTASDFDPEGWKPSFPTVMFDNMTHEDAFWATRIIMSFTEPELRSIVETAGYTDPKDTQYVVQTLLDRRAIIARHWLNKVDALSEFDIQPDRRGVTVRFHNLLVDSHLDAVNPTYTYEIKGAHLKSGRKTLRTSEIVIDRAELSAAVEHAVNSPIELTIWTNRESGVSPPVKVYFEWSAAKDTASLVRISRG